MSYGPLYCKNENDDGYHLAEMCINCEYRTPENHGESICYMRPCPYIHFMNFTDEDESVLTEE